MRSHLLVLIGLLISALMWSCRSGGMREVSADEALPVLYDFRHFASIQDVSGLKLGEHAVEFDAYLPLVGGASWNSDTFQTVESAIRVTNAWSRASANVRVTFDDERRRADVRRVRVSAILTSEGPWIFDFRDSRFLPVHKLPHYDIDSPETLLELGDIALGYTPFALRTVGSCNHVVSYDVQRDSSGVVRNIDLRFSEPTSVVALIVDGAASIESAENTRLMVKDVDAHRLRVDLVQDSAGKAVEGLSVLLVRGDGLAGGFVKDLSCNPRSQAVPFILQTTSTETRWILSPFYEAAEAGQGLKK